MGEHALQRGLMRATSTSNPFGDTETLLAKYFKNINIVFNIRSDDERARHLSVMEGIYPWIDAFCNWYKSTLNIELSNQYLLYNRTLHLAGNGLMRVAECFPRLHQVATENGMSFCVSLEINEYAAHEQEVLELISNKTLTHILLKIEKSSKSLDTATLNRLLETLLKQSIEVDFSGNIQQLLSLSLLDADLFNATDASIFPNQEDFLDDPEFPLSPCNNQMGTFIDAFGRLYPCLPLMGISHARLGSIQEGLSDTVLAGKESLLDLGQLVHQGPGFLVLGQEATTAPFHFPKKCRLHRQYMMAFGTNK